MSRNVYRVFIAHGKDDTWIASQVARSVKDCGASAILDVVNIAKGDNFKDAIYREIADSDELIAILTPWSAKRCWVWVEIGAAWGRGKRLVGVLHGITRAELEEISGGIAVFGEINTLELNEFDKYLLQLRRRAKEARN